MTHFTKQKVFFLLRRCFVSERLGYRRRSVTETLFFADVLYRDVLYEDVLYGDVLYVRRI
jgi:hypothetical protein